MSGSSNDNKTNSIDVFKSYTGIKKAVLLWTPIELVHEVWSWLVGLLQLQPLDSLKCPRR